MSADATAEKKTYTGACHCKKFKFEFQHSGIKQGHVCNCSICIQRGIIFELTKRSEFKFTSGSFDELSVYEFGKKKYKHMFCPVCGSPFIGTESAEGADGIAVNLRATEGIDLESLTLIKHDGASL